jgi:hypothetical protein
MIQAQMKQYPYYLYGSKNSLGELTINTTVPTGFIEMAINILSQSTEDSILYSGCEYIGLTRQEVNDNYVIQYGNNKLKVKYVNKIGRLNQVFLKEM